MRSRTRTLTLVGTTVTLSVILVACSSGAGSGGDSTTTTTADSDDLTTIVTSENERNPVTGNTDTVFTPGDIDKGLDPYIAIAVADVAKRLDIEDDAIEVLTATVVVWSDAGLGCPEPDMFYAQVPTDGSLIELGVDGTVYRYHSGGKRQPFLCDQPLKQPPAVNDNDL